MDNEKEEKIKSKFKLGKIIKYLSDIKGRHTELVTVYVPTGYNLHDVVAQLRSEQSTAENIKSKTVKKNVTTALEKIMRHLQLHKKTPENGMAIFCGNISEKEGATDIELMSIEPPEPIKTKLYWCDQTFVLEPLLDMVEEKEIYGIICMDTREADIAFLKGKKIEPIFHQESIVPGKTRAGGQSSARFARVREGLLNDWLKKVGEAVNKIFEEHKDVIGILLSGPGPIKEIFMKEDYIHADIKKKIIGTVDIGYTGEYGLHETLERGEALIKEASVVKEKKILQRFFTELQKPSGFAVYGLDETEKALGAGTVDTVIISEASKLAEIEYNCACGTKTRIVNISEKHGQTCDVCGQQMNIMGEKDIIEYFEEKVKNFGSLFVVVSSDTREGQQFEAMDGIGAILRYRSG
ncbi:MAG: peptide chain release factor aRF-1 [Candidatus Aenigmatarchaeota archaeon]